MTEADLARRIARHNRLNLTVGLAIIPLALLLWYLSYLLLPRLFSWPFDPFFAEWYNGAPPQPYSIWLAWIVLGLLAFDACRRMAPHFGWGSFSEGSGFDSSFRLGKTTISYGRPAADQGSVFYWVYLFFACAPRTTAAAADFIADRIPASASAITQAAATLKSLRKANQWQPADLYKDAAEGIQLLATMRLAWLRTHNNEVQIRYPPAGE